jgi:mono/diheme cytochrome c family protein
VPRKLQATLALAATLLTGGCNWYYNDVPSIDEAWYLVPWFDHMIAQRSVHPYSRADVPRYTVAGTVPITGGERDWRTGEMVMAGFPWDTMVARRLQNPTSGVPTARGDTLYNIYCAVCHGTDGNSATATVGPRLAAPSLLTDRAGKLVDGNIYSIIRYGRGVMPMYGDKVTRPEDRWAIVNYVRHLQSQAPAVNTGAAGGN